MVNISLTSFFVFLCFQLRFLNCSAQIALESVYDSAGYTVQSSLAIVNLEEDGEKFVRIVRTATERKMDLYNMDHSWWKTIECISFPVDSNSAQPMVNNYFMYISQHLFNLDDEIEFLYFSPSDASFSSRLQNCVLKINFPEIKFEESWNQSDKLPRKLR